MQLRTRNPSANMNLSLSALLSPPVDSSVLVLAIAEKDVRRSVRPINEQNNNPSVLALRQCNHPYAQRHVTWANRKMFTKTEVTESEDIGVETKRAPLSL